MSEQTVSRSIHEWSSIYEWIEAMRNREDIAVEVEVDLTAPDPAYIPGSLVPTRFDARAVVESITFTGGREWEVGEGDLMAPDPGTGESKEK